MNKEFAERAVNAMTEQKVRNIIMSQYVKEMMQQSGSMIQFCLNNEKFNYIILTICDTLIELEKKNGEPQKYVMTTISDKPHIAFKNTEDLYHLINEIEFMSNNMLVRSGFNRMFEHSVCSPNLRKHKSE